MGADDTQRMASSRDEDTVVERRASAPPRRAEDDSATLTTVAGTKALGDEAATRAMVAGWVTLFLSLLGVSLLQLSPHRTLAHWLTTGSVAALALAVVWSLRSYYRARSFLRRIPVVGVMAALTLLSTTAYVGLLSPLCAVLPVLVYFFGLDDSPSRAWSVYATVALGYLALTATTFLGVTPLTTGVIALTKDYSPGLLSIALAMQGLFLGTFALGRFSRRATLHAMVQLERARAQVRRQGALLSEAQAELDDALKGARNGRFTGRVVGEFSLGEVLGRGGVGEVYVADRGDGGPGCAVKVLHPYIADDPIHVERFFREVHVLESLESPHVVRVLASGRADDGSPYFAMELLTGSDLADLLRARDQLTLRETVDLVSQVARGLEVTQEAGIVHRDIKPRTLFLSKSGGSEIWKVLDFGISKVAEGAGTLTHGAAIGTPSYMSPEQALGKTEVDHRSDIFSLALVAYRCLTGRPAFTAPDPAVTMLNIRYAQPVRPAELGSLPEDIDAVLALALAKDPDRRFRSATSFAAALRDASRGELDEAFRKNAAALLAEHPWGSDLAEASFKGR